MRLALLLGMILAAACQATKVPPTPSASPRTVTSTATAAPIAATRLSTSPPSATPEAGLRISPVDGMTQLRVPAGTVTMGGVDVYAEGDELPAHVVHIAAFWIDQVEVTNAMYQLCVQATGCTPPARAQSENRTSYFDNPDFRDYPVINVNWEQATAYCNWAGRRLPTEAQWERAARGDDLRTYPWGDAAPDQTRVNFNNRVGDTSRVGSYAAGASPFGALDMAGNVWEWVADLYKANYYALSPDANPEGPEPSPGLFERVIRGGSFQDARVNIRLSNRGRAAGPNPALASQDPARGGQSSQKTGVRCAQGD
jgi:formylglycine-generating enzyme required for sulfatase activity